VDANRTDAPPNVYASVIDELEELYADGQSVSFHALRQIPRLENVLKESLRLHPPLIILMRVAKGEFEVEGYPIHEGELVAASPAISNRIAEDFPDPDNFVPQRYKEPRQEDLVNRWTWIPFGAGRHRCVGRRLPPCKSKRFSRCCCASTSSKWPATRKLPQRPLQDGGAVGQPATVRYRQRKRS